MAHTDNHPCALTVPGQGKIRVMFRGKGNVADQPLRRLLIHLELLHRGPGDGLRRLGSFVFHVQVRPFKMDPQDLGSLVPFSHHRRHIGHSFSQHLRHLRHRGGQDPGDSLLRDPPHPVPQSFRLPELYAFYFVESNLIYLPVG